MNILWASQLAVIAMLILAGSLFWLPRRKPAEANGIERIRFAPWLRWMFLGFALLSSSISIVIWKSGLVVIFLFGYVIPIASGICFIYCSRYFIEVSDSNVLVGTLFGTRLFAITEIGKLAESAGARSAKSLTAFDRNGKKLFIVTDNIQDFEFITGQIKRKVGDGTLLVTPGFFSGNKSVIHRRH